MKKDVGLQLAILIALNNIYDKPMDTGPVYESMLIQENKVVLNFTHHGSGLMVKDKYGYIRGFGVGYDQQFHYAKAFLENNKVVVYANEVTSSLCVMPGLMTTAMPIYQL